MARTPRRSFKKRSNRKKSRRRSRRSVVGKCRKYLQKKIQINMEEMKKGFYKNKAQAIAVAYSQVRKEHPACKRVLRKSTKKSRKPRYH